jgi:PAP2 superfamily
VISVHTVALTWRQATALAAGLGLLAQILLLHRRTQRLSGLVRESAYLAGLYALWQLVGTLATGTAGAFHRAVRIIDLERSWHLPRESGVQDLIAKHPLLAQACNLYYATMHFTGLFVLLLWLFLRHRHGYAQVRTTVALFTGACLLIQFVPVAPPRLMPELGFVDVAAKYGQSVYGGFGVAADQLSAMPSVHVGWAVLIAVTAVTVSRSRWRWLVLLHPALTVFVVVATGNHFWLDGIVATGVLAVVMIGQRLGRAARAARRPPVGPVVTAEPALVPIAESTRP